MAEEPMGIRAERAAAAVEHDDPLKDGLRKIGEPQQRIDDLRAELDTLRSQLREAVDQREATDLVYLETTRELEAEHKALEEAEAALERIKNQTQAVKARNIAWEALTKEPKRPEVKDRVTKDDQRQDIPNEHPIPLDERDAWQALRDVHAELYDLRSDLAEANRAYEYRSQQFGLAQAQADKLASALRAIAQSKNAHPGWAPEVARSALQHTPPEQTGEK